MVVAENESTPRNRKEKEDGTFCWSGFAQESVHGQFFDPRTGKHHPKSCHIKEIGSFVRELHCDDVVGVESTNNTRYFVNQVRDSVKEVKVINPSQFRVIS